MTRSDLIGACLLLLIAGHEATATLIGNAMWCFDEHPEAWQQVLADPGEQRWRGSRPAWA